VLKRILLAGTLTVALGSPTPAQVTIDISKIQCNQFLLYTIVDPRDLTLWLSGFYNGKTGNTVIDTQRLKGYYETLKDYCRNHWNDPLMQAAQKVLDSRD
jgi:acid stress chaperone HdeB